MSPIGGVGINLAIQDAIAAANRLAPALRAHRVTTDALAAVQARRAPQDPGASGRDPGPHARPGAGRPDRGRAADRAARAPPPPTAAAHHGSHAGGRPTGASHGRSAPRACGCTGHRTEPSPRAVTTVWDSDSALVTIHRARVRLRQGAPPWTAGGHPLDRRSAPPRHRSAPPGPPGWPPGLPGGALDFRAHERGACGRRPNHGRAFQREAEGS